MTGVHCYVTKAINDIYCKDIAKFTVQYLKTWASWFSIWLELCFCLFVFNSTCRKLKIPGVFFLSFFKRNLNFILFKISLWKGNCHLGMVERVIFSHFHHAEFIWLLFFFFNSMNCGMNFLNAHAGHFLSHRAVCYTEVLLKSTHALKISMPDEEFHRWMIALITISLHSTALTTISDPSQFMLKIFIQ